MKKVYQFLATLMALVLLVFFAGNSNAAGGSDGFRDGHEYQQEEICDPCVTKVISEVFASSYFTSVEEGAEIVESNVTIDDGITRKLMVCTFVRTLEDGGDMMCSVGSKTYHMKGEVRPASEAPRVDDGLKI